MEFSAGDTVQLFGLRSKPHLNGNDGDVAAVLKTRARVKVNLRCGTSISLKPANLRLLKKFVKPAYMHPACDPDASPHYLSKKHMPYSCAVCHFPQATLCKGCGVASYCGPHHQKQHWPGHKRCGLLLLALPLLSCLRIPRSLSCTLSLAPLAAPSLPAPSLPSMVWLLLSPCGVERVHMG